VPNDDLPSIRCLLLGLQPDEEQSLVQLSGDLIEFHRLAPGDRLPPVNAQYCTIVLADMDWLEQLEKSGWFASQPSHFGWHLGILSRSDVQWISVSSHADRYPESRCQLGGAVGYLTRPFTPRDAFVCIMQAADQPRRRRTLRPQTELLRLAHALRASMLLRISTPNRPDGQIAILQGEVVSAQIGEELRDTAALPELLNWNCRSIQGNTLLAEQSAARITLSFEQVLDLIPTQVGEAVVAPPPSSCRILDSYCRKVLDIVSGSMACGVVDLSTGILLGSSHIFPTFTSAHLDVLAAASVDMFRGRNVRRIEEMLSKIHGEEIRDTFEEIFISTTHTNHFIKLIRDKKALAILVAKATTHLESGWSGLRNSIPMLASAIS